MKLIVLISLLLVSIGHAAEPVVQAPSAQVPPAPVQVAKTTVKAAPPAPSPAAAGFRSERDPVTGRIYLLGPGDTVESFRRSISAN